MQSQVSFSDDLEKVKSGEMSIRKLCLGCKSAEVKTVGDHPYFEGSLCKICMVRGNNILFAH
jgi:hypothetical protein